MRIREFFTGGLLIAGTVVASAGEVIPQSAWSRDGTRPVPEKMVKHTAGISSVVIHHTQSPNEIAAFQRARLVNVQRYHIVERGWGDIAYHYLIGADGIVFEGRDADFRGDSGTTYDLDGRLLICVLGDFTEQLPEPEALKALVQFTAAQLFLHELSIRDLVTHRMVAATECPGDRLQRWFDEEGLKAIAGELKAIEEAH